MFPPSTVTTRRLTFFSIPGSNNKTHTKKTLATFRFTSQANIWYSSTFKGMLNVHPFIQTIMATRMISMFEGQPPKTRPFPIKTVVIWVLGILWIYIYIDTLEVQDQINNGLDWIVYVLTIPDPTNGQAVWSPWTSWVYMFPPTSLAMVIITWATKKKQPYFPLNTRVIQVATFASPIVGGHQQPLTKGHVFTIPKKSLWITRYWLLNSGTLMTYGLWFIIPTVT